METIMYKLLLPLAALALIGCGDLDDTNDKDDTAPPDDTDTGPVETPDTEIDEVTYGFDTVEWSYEADILGWAESAHLTITQDTSSPWDEEHDLVQGDYDPDGMWDTWGITLPITADWADQESGVNTLFAGDAAMEATMLWRIDVYDGGAIADCVYWAGASADVSLIADAACRELTF
jgi:hypothetical protein